MTNLKWFKVCAGKDLRPGQARSISIGAHPYAVFNVDGELHGLEAACGHMKANLAAGRLSGNVVECAMHGWEYDVKTGQCLSVESRPLHTFPVKVENEYIWIGLEEPKQESE
ncbi:Rieske 2Fe-2S domain-containing protein [bacterium]|nr:Rieske 2Fe-2S domain-containing protein [bacterium]MBU1984882.1 Rieske 2Fe-2S domain-containing protein [bacterium]